MFSALLSNHVNKIIVLFSLLFHIFMGLLYGFEIAPIINNVCLFACTCLANHHCTRLILIDFLHVVVFASRLLHLWTPMWLLVSGSRPSTIICLVLNTRSECVLCNVKGLL